MNKIICNSVEVVFKNDILSMTPGEAPVLIDSEEWKKIEVVEQPVYQSNVKQSDAGPTNEETVNAKANHDEISKMICQYNMFYVILRMRTDNETFYVGNLEYPCVMEFTSDKIYDTYTFKAISPA